VRAYNFGISGSSLTKIYQAMRCEAVVIMWVQFLEGLQPAKFVTAKKVQNSAQFLTTFDFEHE